MELPTSDQMPVVFSTPSREESGHDPERRILVSFVSPRDLESPAKKKKKEQLRDQLELTVQMQVMTSPGSLVGVPPDDPADVLGPILVGGLGEGVLQGVLLLQLILFIEKPTNNRILCLAVYWINVIAL